MFPNQPAYNYSRYQYPFQNFLPADLDGEEWKEIDGYDGAYFISDLGRIKSTARLIEFISNGKEISFWTNERILKQRLLKKYNHTTQSYNEALTVSLSKKPWRKHYVVSRLVYQAFILNIDHPEDKLIVAHRNNDALDNNKANLFTTSQSIYFKQICAEGRMPHSLKLNEHIDATVRHQAAQKKFRPVSQYDMDGNLILFYDCIADAARSVKAFASNIRLALTGEKVSAAGFLWREGKGSSTIDVSEEKKRIKAHKTQQCKPITRYDLNGNRTGTYSSVAAAARAVNGNRSAIRKATAGKVKISYNSIWRSGQGPARIKKL